MIPSRGPATRAAARTSKAFHEYPLVAEEPWDGPASIAFTDGRSIGAIAGPQRAAAARYYVTKDDLVIMASEVGVLDIPAENILHQGAPAPGPDLPDRYRAGPHHLGRRDQARLASRRRYGAWSPKPGGHSHATSVATGCAPHLIRRAHHETMLQRRQQAFGYSHEDLRILLTPMANDGEEAIGSMGDDTSLAVLSRQVAAAHRLLQAALRAGDEPAGRRVSASTR